MENTKTQPCSCVIHFSLFLLLAGLLTAQLPFTTANFEAEVLAYQPPQRSGVSDKSFDFGSMVLGETVRQTGNDPAAFNCADYCNVLTAFLALGESEQDLKLVFERFRASGGSCEYFTSEGFKEAFVDKQRGNPVAGWWTAAEADCRAGGSLPATRAPVVDYAAANGLNVDLLQLIAGIDEADQRFREGSYQSGQQKPLDRENERLIDSLYGVYGTYLGTSLVGEAYNSVMWAVIQHSRPETMERYLPVVHAAVQAGELGEAPLRMLIDRVQVNKTGKQVFGSQVGVPLLPKAERKRIEKQYGID